jgi:GT2 family glycosyltransferase
MADLITAIIPSLHRPDLTKKCIASLERQILGVRLAIIVVENDARPSVLPESLPQNAERLLLDRNFGFAGAVNRALLHARGDYVLLVNNDVDLRPDCVRSLWHALEATPGAAFAVAKLFQQGKPDILDGAWDGILLGGGAYRVGHGSPDDEFLSRSRQVLAGCAACMLIRTALLHELGAFDEYFFAYLEDLDFALRALLCGYSGLYVPSAVSFHLGSATLGGGTPGMAMHPKVSEWITRNQLLVVTKNYPASVLLRVFPRIFIFQILWFALMLRRGVLIPYCKGVAGFLRRLPGAVRKRHAIQAGRKISANAFLKMLRESEAQIATWQKSLPSERRSLLLKIYFGIFGWPDSHNQPAATAE